MNVRGLKQIFPGGPDLGDSIPLSSRAESERHATTQRGIPGITSRHHTALENCLETRIRFLGTREAEESLGRPPLTHGVCVFFFIKNLVNAHLVSFQVVSDRPKNGA
jgi:hypothetical protein